MRVTRTRRVPFLLLGLLAASVLFPRAFDAATLTVASWLPARTRVAPDPVRLPAEEVQSLKARIARLERELAARPSGDAAIPGLRYAERPSSAATVALTVQILNHDVSRDRRSFVIDAGRDQGVRPGMPVIQGDSLVGVVDTAVARAARVLRVDDRSTRCRFPATVLASDGAADAPTRGQGVVRGTGDSGAPLRVEFLAPGGARVGDLVTTGAGSGTVPEGLLLGQVAEVGDGDRDGAFEAEVVPLRDLDRMGTVLVLLVEGPGLGVSAK